VEVRDVVLCTDLHEHSDDDAKEAAQFRHKRILHFGSERDQLHAVRPTILAITRAAGKMFFASGT
jgi:hypothetical protein